MPDRPNSRRIGRGFTITGAILLLATAVLFWLAILQEVPFWSMAVPITGMYALAGIKLGINRYTRNRVAEEQQRLIEEGQEGNVELEELTDSRVNTQNPLSSIATITAKLLETKPKTFSERFEAVQEAYHQLTRKIVENEQFPVNDETKNKLNLLLQKIQK